MTLGCMTALTVTVALLAVVSTITSVYALTQLRAQKLREQQRAELRRLIAAPRGERRRHMWVVPVVGGPITLAAWLKQSPGTVGGVLVATAAVLFAASASAPHAPRAERPPQLLPPAVTITPPPSTATETVTVTPTTSDPPVMHVQPPRQRPTTTSRPSPPVTTPTATSAPKAPTVTTTVTATPTSDPACLLGVELLDLLRVCA